MIETSLETNSGHHETGSHARFEPLLRKLRDSLTLMDGIRFCAAFNGGGLIGLVGYVGFLVGLENLGISRAIFIPMVATFSFGLLFAGLATTVWFASRHHMAHAGALVIEGAVEKEVREIKSFRRAGRLQGWTTSLVAASYVTFLALR